MRQGRGEKIRNWAAQIKGQANICNYETTVKCKKCNEENKADFSDHVVRQIIAANLNDPDIQKDLLSEMSNKSDPMTSEKVIEFIEVRENGKESALRLSSLHTSAAMSSHRRSMRPPGIKTSENRTITTPQHKQKELCSYCNTTGHGNHTGVGSAQMRKKLGCPAYGKQCTKCQLYNHFNKVCRSEIQSASPIEEATGEEFTIGGAIGILQD